MRCGIVLSDVDDSTNSIVGVLLFLHGGVLLRKKLVLTIMMLVLIIWNSIPVYALSTEQSTAIQSFLDDARRISKAPGMAVAVTVKGETHFFSSGVANREAGIFADDKTLWELASVSKAFTALGLLYLEEQGLLSLDDSVAKHLPWLTLHYKGQLLNMQEVKLYHFLHHTVGITNYMHPNRVLDRPGPDTLQNTGNSLINAELAFFPGEKMEYGTKNYNILGLTIEAVSGRSYEDFMENEIFIPLGLTQTFANRDNAETTSLLSKGYRNNFLFATTINDSPEARGSVPVGYIIASAEDMARWMGIQIGIIQDVPDVFRAIVSRSHEQGQGVAAPDGGYYAAGWEVNLNEGTIEHGGGNPGFSTYVLLFPEEQIGVTLLANLSGVDAHLIAKNIKGILNGDLQQAYSMSIVQILDIAVSIFTVAAGLLIILLVFLALRRRRQGQKRHLSTKRVTLTVILFVISVALCLLLAFPGLIFSGGWSFILIWAPYSLLTGTIALMLLSISVTWFVAFPCRIK